MDQYEARAQALYNHLGLDGLRLVARTDRGNADSRYRMGDIDFALTQINRARAVEELIEQIERDKSN